MLSIDLWLILSSHCCHVKRKAWKPVPKPLGATASCKACTKTCNRAMHIGFVKWLRLAIGAKLSANAAKHWLYVFRHKNAATWCLYSSEEIMESLRSVHHRNLSRVHCFHTMSTPKSSAAASPTDRSYRDLKAR